MSFQMDGQLNADDIRAVRKLDDIRPVYLVVGDSEKIVVKRDNTPQPHDPRNMRYALRNMKIVDRTMESRQLTSDELNALETFVELQRVESTLLNMPLPPAVTALSQDILHTGSNTWLKTNFFEGLINLEGAATQARRDGDKGGIRAIAKALSAADGLEKLGRILAIDCFNGNDDRFDFSDAPVVNAGYHRLTNPGNVAVCLQNNMLRPVGMDAYAGSAEFRSLAEAGRPDPRWAGYRLRDDQKPWRMRFAQEVAADLETALGPRNRKVFFASKNRLPGNAGERIARGMDDGITELKKTLLRIFAPNARPPGLSARMIALGWAIQARAGLQPAPPSGPRPF